MRRDVILWNLRLLSYVASRISLLYGLNRLDDVRHHDMASRLIIHVVTNAFVHGNAGRSDGYRYSFFFNVVVSVQTCLCLPAKLF